MGSKHDDFDEDDDGDEDLDEIDHLGADDDENDMLDFKDFEDLRDQAITTVTATNNDSYTFPVDAAPSRTFASAPVLLPMALAAAAEARKRDAAAAAAADFNTLRHLSFCPREEKNMPMEDKVQRWLEGVYMRGTLVERVESGTGEVRRRVVNPYPPTADDTASESSGEDARAEKSSRLITRQTVRAYRNERAKNGLDAAAGDSASPHDSGGASGSGSGSGESGNGGPLMVGGARTGEPGGSGIGARARKHIKSKAYALAHRVMKPGFSDHHAGTGMTYASVAAGTAKRSSGGLSGLRQQDLAKTSPVSDYNNMSILDTSYIEMGGQHKITNEEGAKSDPDNNNTTAASFSFKRKSSALSSSPVAPGKPSCLPLLSKSSGGYYSTELGTHARRQYERPE